MKEGSPTYRIRKIGELCHQSAAAPRRFVSCFIVLTTCEKTMLFPFQKQWCIDDQIVFTEIQNYTE